MRLSPNYPLQQLSDLFYNTYQRPVHLVSAYRSDQEQARAYYRPHTGPVAPPGRSRHRYGEALDVSQQDIAAVNRLPLQQIGLETLAHIGDPGHIQMIKRADKMAAKKTKGRFTLLEDEPQAQAPAAPAAAPAALPQAPGLMAEVQRWRERPLPTAEEREKAIRDAAAMPDWQRRLLFTAVRNIKGANPLGMFREKGLESLEGVFQEAEKRKTGKEYGLVSQAVPWVLGAWGPYELAYGAAMAGGKAIPGVKKLIGAAQKFPGLFQRGRYLGLPGSAEVVPGAAAKAKGALARAGAGGLIFPAMDIIKQGKLPTVGDVGVGMAAGTLFGPGAFRVGEVPKARPGTPEASEEVAGLQKNVDEEVFQAFGGSESAAAAPQVVSAAPATPIKPSMTFDPGFMPEREPLKIWHPGAPGEAAVPPRSPFHGQPSTATPWKSEVPTFQKKDLPWQRIEQVQDTIAEGLGKGDPEVNKIIKKTRRKLKRNAPAD